MSVDIQTRHTRQRESIPAKAAEAFRLRNEGKSIAEICDALGLKRQTVLCYITKVRASLGIQAPIRRVHGSLAERMAAFTDKENGPMCEALGSKCWIWTGMKKRGYGYIQDTRGEIGERYAKHCSHRVAYMLATGERLKWRSYDSVVRHMCHNPACVRVDHLEVGTQYDNMHDAIERGTHPSVTGVLKGRRKRGTNAA